jgi:hypothetical protein
MVYNLHTLYILNCLLFFLRKNGIVGISLGVESIHVSACTVYVLLMFLYIVWTVLLSEERETQRKEERKLTGE